MSFYINATHFDLVMYSDTGRLRWLYFLILALMYALALLGNLLLLVIILLERCLNQPMYIFLFSLFLNELSGGTAIFPFLLFQILQDEHKISYPLCFFQIFFVYMYAITAILTLAAMSYDRFVAICFPLQYHIRLSSQKALKMVTGIWIFVLLEVGFMISLSAPLSLCGNQIPKVYCDNYSVVKLACGNISVNNVYGVLYTCLVALLVPTLIIYSYVRIIRVCLNSCKRTRHKALSTCVPHVASLLNMGLASFFEVMQSRFDMRSVPDEVRVFLSLYFLVSPPIFNPLIYGLNLSKIHTSCRNRLWPKKTGRM